MNRMKMNVRRIRACIGGAAAIGTVCAGIALAPFTGAARGDTPDAAATQPNNSSPTTAPATQPRLTLINLHMKQAMPEDVFDAIAKQAGVRFSTNGNLWDQDSMQTALDVDLTNRPFWPALMDVCQMWDLTVQNNNYGPGNGAGPPRLQLFPRSQMGDNGATPFPECESDGILIQAVRFLRNTMINYSDPSRKQDNCSIQLRVYIDPAMHVMNFGGAARVEEAVDDQGHSMALPQNNNSGGYGGYGYGGPQGRLIVLQSQVPLKFPDNAGKSIAHLKGYLTVRVIEGSQTVTVDNPLTAAESDSTVGDTKIMFHSMHKTQQGYMVKISMSRDDDDANNSDYWSLVNAAQLLDARGRNFNSSGGGGGGGGGNGIVDYTLNYFKQDMGNGGGASGDPAKWILEVPLKIRTIKIPFDLHDLPLPGQ